MKKVLLSIVMLMTATAVFSQPRVNDDGTVTFRYKNDSAKVVMVDVQFAGRNETCRTRHVSLLLHRGRHQRDGS